MDFSPETLMSIAGWGAAALCLAAVIILALREKKKTGSYPAEVVGDRPGDASWFLLIWIGWIMVRGNIPDSLVGVFPVSILVTGVDLALAVALVAMVGLAYSKVFKENWKGVWTEVVMWQLFVVVCAWSVYRDAKAVAATPWVWVFAAGVAAFLSPVLAKLAYQHFYLRGRRTEN